MVLKKLVDSAVDQIDVIKENVENQIEKLQEEAKVVTQNIENEIERFQEEAKDHMARFNNSFHKNDDEKKKDESVKSDLTTNEDEDEDDFISPLSSTNIIVKPPTHSDTPTQFLKKLRSPSILSRQTTGGSTASSLDEASVSSSVSDSVRCNNANMPNKITGEMGVEIYPCPKGKEEIILQYVHDRHFQYIHPNVFAPACLTNVQRMGGGGSGVSVFSGTHPILGEIVMKHGGFSDMKELFALGTIAQQLNKRGQHSPESKEASKAMKACLPEFKMVYISPQHVLYKPKAVWGKLKKLVKIGRDRSTRESFASLAQKIEMSERHLQARKSHSGVGGGGVGDDASKRQLPLMPQLITLDDSKFLGPGANIRIYECDSGNPVAYIEDRHFTRKPSLNFVLPKNHIRAVEDIAALALECNEDFDALHHLYEGLSPLMSKHLFKFTLAQKRIGGKHAKTGSQWLYDGQLDGLVLGNLIAQFIATVRNLQALTLPEEVDVVDEIRKELQQLRETPGARSDSLSAMADQYMGHAIKKNFHPQKGRIRFLRKTCKGFSDQNTFYLEQEEEEPAKHLATLVKPNALMSDVFVGASSEPPLFHPDKDFWLNIMAFATDRCRSPSATKRVWTSGLCDAGIHNLFVSRDDLYFFDLGVPALQSLPGFMTKFLFSFFHILGMQEDPDSGDGEWVRRFEVRGDKLALTQETKDLLPKAYDAFEVSLARIIEEVFDGDQSLRWLLLQYVTLQLLSDASFCLQRWSMKGGGHPREDNNHNDGLERWLWRALWDVFVAFDINTLESWERLNIEDPDSYEFANELRASIARTSIDSKELQELLRLDQLAAHPEESGSGTTTTTTTTEPPFGSECAHIHRKSKRWSSERLNLSTLRELSTAAFEYNGPICEIAEEDDDDSDSETETSYGGDSDEMPVAVPSMPKPSRHSLASLEEGHEGEE